MAKKLRILVIFLLPFESVIFLSGWIIFYFGLKRPVFKKAKKRTENTLRKIKEPEIPI